MPTRRDYDADPDRYRTGIRVSAAHLPPGVSLYGRIAALLRSRGATRVLDVGCGEGALRAAVAGEAWVVSLDGSATMLAAVAPPVVRAEATALPFAEATFDAVVAVTGFLVARFVPAGRAARDAATVATPIVLTKRGALVLGHKRS